MVMLTVLLKLQVLGEENPFEVMLKLATPIAVVRTGPEADSEVVSIGRSW